MNEHIINHMIYHMTYELFTYEQLLGAEPNNSSC